MTGPVSLYVDGVGGRTRTHIIMHAWFEWLVTLAGAGPARSSHGRSEIWAVGGRRHEL